MSNIRLSSRYAKSLISLAAERGETDVLLKDMLYISSSIHSSKDLQVMLSLVTWWMPMLPTITLSLICVDQLRG